MFGSEILEVGIGIVFVFLLVSIIASAFRESIEAWSKTRAAYLERGIRELLHDKHAVEGGLARAFYEHPLVSSLYASSYTPRAVTERPPIFIRGRGLPSYIPARNFALALMDIAVRGPVTDAVSGDPDAPALTIDTLRLNIRNLGNPAVQRVLLTAVDSAQGDLGRAQLAIQAWFDSGMDRVSGWYKRSTYAILFWIGLIVAIGLNVDTISIARYLYHNDAARAVIVARAEKVAGDSAFLASGYAAAKADLDSLRLPIGWPRPVMPGASAKAGGADFGLPPWYLSIPGWLITALAATVGAPFWFDMLNKFMVIRSTVKPHEKSPEESSEDRQHPKPRTERVIEATGAVSGADSVTGGGGPPPRPIPQSTLMSTPRDATSSIDGCTVETPTGGPPIVVHFETTADEDLPPAEGGVA